MSTAAADTDPNLQVIRADRELTTLEAARRRAQRAVTPRRGRHESRRSRRILTAATWAVFLFVFGGIFAALIFTLA